VVLTSCSETRDHARNKDEGRTLGSSLQRATDQGKYCGIEDPIDTADAISHPSANETTDNGA